MNILRHTLAAELSAEIRAAGIPIDGIDYNSKSGALVITVQCQQAATKSQRAKAPRIVDAFLMQHPEFAEAFGLPNGGAS